ncbi:MAG TPA: phosphonate metabolism transcriptional regulator PhnF [Xanthobacteraceae bacterium]|nr:phosphonate metabolism transcriptional regulator PhnF [Xanthobacteraceae bacterium]
MTDMSEREKFTETLLEESGSGVTRWRRVADELERAIADGTFKSGSKLPAENDIAARFGVNRHTVRRAIATLAERGLLRAERGSGTYVEAQRLAYPIRKRTRFSEIVGDTGRAVSGKLIASAVEAADTEIARRLRLKPGTPVSRLETLRYADRVPLSTGTIWMPAQRFPDAAEIYASVRSVTKTLAHFGVHNYSRKSTHITAAIVDATDAARLEIIPGRPVLCLDGVDVDGEDCPVLTTHSRFVADRIALIVET